MFPETSAIFLVPTTIPFNGLIGEKDILTIWKGTVRHSVISLWCRRNGPFISITYFSVVGAYVFIPNVARFKTVEFPETTVSIGTYCPPFDIYPLVFKLRVVSVGYPPPPINQPVLELLFWKAKKLIDDASSPTIFIAFPVVLGCKKKLLFVFAPCSNGRIVNGPIDCTDDTSRDIIPIGLYAIRPFDIPLSVVEFIDKSEE